MVVVRRVRPWELALETVEKEMVEELASEELDWPVDWQ